jgi:hypothetical protein
MRKFVIILIIAPVLLMAFVLPKPKAKKRAQYIIDMVQNNPGEPLTKTVFNDPAFLKNNGYSGQVIADFTFAHAALTFDKLNPNIFPIGSKERAWVNQAAERVRQNIKRAHQAGIKIYYFTDIIVLPKKLVELYHDEICDDKGRISFERPKTIEIHRLMLNELFDTFPELDGLVIRTGETYLNNVPYHTGNNPITNGEESHVKLINLLREEVCEKRHKMVFYRTWSFGGMHDNPDYYLKVTNQIKPHPNLVFSIKHTKGDYHRTFDFNPTLGIGKHAQIVEIQCQREYQGKGAYPNYVMDGVINGFEEYSTNTPKSGLKDLNELKNNPNFKGIWSWSRGGGWVGPYISNEFWCRLNAYVISHWAANTNQSEQQVFNGFMDQAGIQGSSRPKFRELCLLSAQAVLRGHYSAKLPFDKNWAWWMRDEFLAGIDRNSAPFSSEGALLDAYTKLDSLHLLQKAVDEKYEAVALWKKILNLSSEVRMTNKADQEYLQVSSQYGLILHQIIAEGWNIMAKGFTGDKTGKYDVPGIRNSINNYDTYWKQYKQLKDEHLDCATLYKPYAFEYVAPKYHGEKGMGASVDQYRKLISNQ